MKSIVITLFADAWLSASLLAETPEMIEAGEIVDNFGLAPDGKERPWTYTNPQIARLKVALQVD